MRLSILLIILSLYVLYIYNSILDYECLNVYIQYNETIWEENEEILLFDNNPFSIYIIDNYFNNSMSEWLINTTIKNGGEESGDFLWQFICDSDLILVNSSSSSIINISSNEEISFTSFLVLNNSIIDNYCSFEVQVLPYDSNCLLGKYYSQSFILSSYCNEPYIQYPLETWIEIYNLNYSYINPFNIIISNWIKDQYLEEYYININFSISIYSNSTNNIIIQTDCIYPQLDYYTVLIPSNKYISLNNEINESITIIVQMFNETIKQEIYQQESIQCNIKAQIDPFNQCWNSTFGKVISDSFIISSYPWIDINCDNIGEPFLVIPEEEWNECNECYQGFIENYGYNNPLHIEIVSTSITEYIIYFDITGYSSSFINIEFLSDSLDILSIHPYPIDSNSYKYWLEEQTVHSFSIIVNPIIEEIYYNITINIHIIDNMECWSSLGKRIQQFISFQQNTINTNTCDEEAFLIFPEDNFIYSNNNPIDNLENPFQISTSTWNKVSYYPLEYSTEISSTIINGGNGSSIILANLQVPNIIYKGQSELPDNWCLQLKVTQDVYTSSCYLYPYSSCILSFNINIIEEIYLSNCSIDIIDYNSILNIQIPIHSCWSNYGKEYSQSFQLPTFIYNESCLSYSEPYLLYDRDIWENNYYIIESIINPLYIKPYYNIDTPDNILLIKSLEDWNFEITYSENKLYTIYMNTTIINGSPSNPIPINTIEWNLECNLYPNTYYKSYYNECGIIKSIQYKLENITKEYSINPLSNKVFPFTIQILTDENKDYCNMITKKSNQIECSLEIQLVNSCWSTIGKSIIQQFIIPHFSNDYIISNIEGISSSDSSISSSNNNNELYISIFVILPFLFICCLCFCIIIIIIGILKYKNKSIRKNYFKGRKRRQYELSWNSNNNEEDLALYEMEVLESSDINTIIDNENNEYNEEQKNIIKCSYCDKKAQIQCCVCSSYYCSLDSICWNFIHSSLLNIELHKKSIITI